MRTALFACLALPCILMAQDALAGIKPLAAHFASRQKAYYEWMAASAGKASAKADSASFFAEDIQAAEARLAREGDPEIQAALRIMLVAYRAGKTLSARTEGLDDLARISPVSPAWEVAPVMFMLASSRIKDEAARQIYVDRAEAGSPVRALKEQLTLTAFVRLHDAKDEKGWKAKLQVLEQAFPESEATKSALKILKADRAASVGLPAPAFDVAALDEPGTHLTLETYKGRFLLLDFWATWCGPCKAMLPTMEQLHAEYGKRGLSILSIADDKSAAIVKEFRKVPGQTMPWDHSVNPYDPKRQTHLYPIGDDYGVRALPTLVLIGPDGKVLAKGEELHKDLRAVLARFIPAS
ncbi:MAG: TlpA family protein disulfide reductase [Holophaga sp.]|nr:TlpA family protein disulfide reductase [Holophaga sp.]